MMDKYKQAFQEEARELLVELESALLELDQNRGDRELVGRAFRALHTIKGSGAMFGFDELAGFTHNLENAFDEVRAGRLAVTPELVALTLAALDHIRSFLEESPQVESGPREQLLTQLRNMTATTGDSPCADAQLPELPSNT